MYGCLVGVEVLIRSIVAERRNKAATMTRTGNDEEEEKQEEAPFEGQPDDSEYEDARESNAQLESSENLGISDDGDLARDAATTGDEEAALGEGSSDNEETKGRKFLPADAPWKDRMWEGTSGRIPSG